MTTRFRISYKWNKNINKWINPKTWESSRNEEPGSISLSILSLGKSLFLFLFLFTASSPPPARTLKNKTIPSQNPTRKHKQTHINPHITMWAWTLFIWDWSWEIRPSMALEFCAKASEFLPTPSGRTPKQKPLFWRSWIDFDDLHGFEVADTAFLAKFLSIFWVAFGLRLFSLTSNTLIVSMRLVLVWNTYPLLFSAYLQIWQCFIQVKKSFSLQRFVLLMIYLFLNFNSQFWYSSPFPLILPKFQLDPLIVLYYFIFASFYWILWFFFFFFSTQFYSKLI